MSSNLTQGKPNGPLVPGSPSTKKNDKLIRALIVIALGVAIWLIPAPTGVKIQAWHLLAIFAATILGFILQPLPMGTMALIGITLSMLLGILKPADALSGFSTPIIWLLVSAFLFAKGFVKTGFGRRVAYLIMRAMGDSTLKLGYVMALTDFVISPATPAANARGGAVVFPIIKSLALTFDSEPGPTARKFGSYLMLTGAQGNVITSTMFMTSAAVGPLITAFAQKILNIQITWGTWALAGIVPGLLCLALMPWILYKIYPPEIKHTPEAKKVASSELEKMGPMSKSEKVMLAVFIISLLLWSTSSISKLDSTAVALFGVCVMLVTKVIDYKDVVEEKSAWDALIWMGSLMTLASFLSSYGLIPWFAKAVGDSLKGVSWPVALSMLVLVYMYSHYGFASMAAHTTALYPAFVAVAAATGAPGFLAVMSLAFLSTLCGGLTHYASGTSPIYFGAGYITQSEWWRYGFIMSLVNIGVFGTVGILWWKVLGLW